MKRNSRKLMGRLILCYMIFAFINTSVIKAARNEVINTKDINNSKDLQEFMDKFFTENMKEYEVPGAAVVVIKDGKEVFKKGYGYSSLDKKIEVKPDETLFPVASISKLFTATAIMQLYEQGKLDINENVEKYFEPYKIDNDYNEIVTCANLLTHSSGIDEASEINGNTRSENNIKSQEYYFENHTPKVVREPNTVSRYSNQGYNILGYVIEKVSGITYEEYIKKNILEPLEMDNSLVRLKNDSTAKGYEYTDEEFIELPLAYQYTSGSSGVITTPKDMENFMVSILDDGKFKGVNILNEVTAKSMKEQQFSNNEVFPGMGYGFIRSNRNGKEILKHEGALPGYTNTMFLIQDENIGIYISTNSLNPLPFNIEDQFLNQFYPQENTKYSNTKVDTNKDYSKYDGTYRSYDGIAKSNIMKIGFLFDPSMDLTIKDNKDGTLTLKEYTSAKEKNITKLIEIEEGIFARKDGKGDFAFELDSSNKVIYAFNDVSHNSFEKIKFYEGGIFNIVLFASTISIFILNIGITIFKEIKRLFKSEVKESSREIKQLNILNFIISLFNIIGFIGALVMAICMISTNDSSFLALLYMLLTLLIISTLLSILSFINIIKIWIKLICTRRDRIYFSIISISNLIFIWLIYYFNFLELKV